MFGVKWKVWLFVCVKLTICFLTCLGWTTERVRWAWIIDGFSVSGSLTIGLSTLSRYPRLIIALSVSTPLFFVRPFLDSLPLPRLFSTIIHTSLANLTRLLFSFWFSFSLLLFGGDGGGVEVVSVPPRAEMAVVMGAMHLGLDMW